MPLPWPSITGKNSDANLNINPHSNAAALAVYHGDKQRRKP
jgi:hypothetical protein